MHGVFLSRGDVGVAVGQASEERSQAWERRSNDTDVELDAIIC